jgi:hypothetical protein
MMLGRLTLLQLSTRFVAVREESEKFFPSQSFRNALSREVAFLTFAHLAVVAASHSFLATVVAESRAPPRIVRPRNLRLVTFLQASA